MAKRGRLTVSLEQELIDAAEEAVAAGRASSVSAWVAEAMAKQAYNESLLKAGREFIADWEAEFGEITEQDMLDAERHHRERAIVVRGGKIYRPGAERAKPA